MIEQVLATLLSGRFIWAASGAFVFCWLGITGKLEPKDVMFILGVIVGFLFRNTNAPKMEVK